MNLKKKKYDTLNPIEVFDETNFIFGNSIILKEMLLFILFIFNFIIDIEIINNHAFKSD